MIIAFDTAARGGPLNEEFVGIHVQTSMPINELLVYGKVSNSGAISRQKHTSNKDEVACPSRLICVWVAHQLRLHNVNEFQRFMLPQCCYSKCHVCSESLM